MILSEILVPLLNANEPEARLVSIHVRDGQMVEAGVLLFTLETTKAATDLESPASGFLRMLSGEGDILPVGAKIAVITENAEDPVELPAHAKKPGPGDPLRITKPARALAESLHVDLAALPADRLVTEEVVRKAAGISQKTEITLPASQKPYLLMYGGGGHAKSVMELANLANQWTIAGIIDDGLPSGTSILNIPVLGDRTLLPDLIERGVRAAANGVGGIIDINIRVAIFDLLASAGFTFPALVHPRAAIEPSAEIGEGVQIFANAYIGAEARLHARCMVNTNAVVSHDCEIGRYSHVAPGVLLAGHVRVGEKTLIGMGVTTAIGIRIGAGVRIGNGVILLADVPDRTIIQAGKVWTGK